MKKEQLLAEFAKMRLLSTSHKIELSNNMSDTFYTVSLNLAPWKLAQKVLVDGKENKFNTCPMAEIAGCGLSCIGEFSGMNNVPANKRSKIIKTLVYYLYRDIFMDKLENELIAYYIKSTIEGFTPVVRLNCYSDLNWHQVIKDYPSIMFYDYSKMLLRSKELINLPNYDITLSYFYNSKNGNNNLKDCLEWLKSGNNISFIYLDDMPETWNGYEVIDGDSHDLRFLDTKGKAVALKFKGTKKAKEAFMGV